MKIPRAEETVLSINIFNLIWCKQSIIVLIIHTWVQVSPNFHLYMLCDG